MSKINTSEAKTKVKTFDHEFLRNTPFNIRYDLTANASRNTAAKLLVRDLGIKSTFGRGLLSVSPSQGLRIWPQVDVDGSGVVEFEEFVKFISRLTLDGNRENEAQECFRRYTRVLIKGQDHVFIYLFCKLLYYVAYFTSCALYYYSYYLFIYSWFAT
jgi:hypothetical protein